MPSPDEARGCPVPCSTSGSYRTTCDERGLSMSGTTTPINSSPPTMPTNPWQVRVWFGSHVIANYAAERGEAEEYAAAMRRRFFGLRVTSEPLHTSVSDIQPLPAKHWWQVPPR
jgi:hypothetical protein